jgi:hypothetical protein
VARDHGGLPHVDESSIIHGLEALGNGSRRGRQDSRELVRNEARMRGRCTSCGLMETHMEKRGSWFRWERWTLARGLSAGAWIMATSLVGLYFVLQAGFAGGPLLGSPPTADILRTGARLMITGAGIIAAGPLGVWLLRRRLPWFVIGLAILVLGSAWSVIFLIESLSAPLEP